MSLNFKRQVKNGSVASGIISSQYSVRQSKTKQTNKKKNPTAFICNFFFCKIWFLPLVLFYFHFKHVLTKLSYSMIVSIQFKVEGFFFSEFW